MDSSFTREKIMKSMRCSVLMEEGLRGVGRIDSCSPTLEPFSPDLSQVYQINSLMGS